jgi:amino acid adenylation domain-containing protein
VTTSELLSELRRLGAHLWLDGEQLRFRLPKGALSPQLRAGLVKHKAEIIAFLHEAQETKNAIPSTPVSIPVVSRDAPIPASYSQERIWFLHQVQTNLNAYNLLNTKRLKGTLNIPAMTRTINELVRRHEPLRTNFLNIDGRPFQVIKPFLNIKLPIIDLSHLSPKEREKQAQHIATREAEWHFDLTEDPLIRTTLLKLEDENFILLIVIHHIVVDGWSMELFESEMTKIYLAFAANQPAPLPELPIQYADFAVWQRNQVENELREKQVAYWRQQLADAPALLELPTDRARPPRQTFDSNLEKLLVDKTVSDQLQTLARTEGVSFFMLITAVLQTQLHRYTAQDHISIGTITANRQYIQTEKLIGLFVNTLVLHTDLSGNPTFQQLLKRVRQVTLEAYANQDTPIEMLIAELLSERSLSYSPFFQVLLVLQNVVSSSDSLHSQELSAEAFNPNRKGLIGTDITFWIEEKQNGLDVVVEYSTALFDRETIVHMLSHFHTLLKQVVENIHTPILNLSLLDSATRHQLLVEWNDNHIDYPQEQCIQRLFEQQAADTPQATAIIFGDQSLTYEQLNQQANQLAHYLQQRGVGSEIPVGIYIEYSLQTFISVLAILKAGGAYVPLDPMYPLERLNVMIKDAQIRVLLTQTGLQSLSTDTLQTTLYIDNDWPDIADHYDVHNPISDTVPENLAYIIFTSGSMGQPRGVMVQNGSLVNAYYAWEKSYGLRSDVSSHLQMANFSFDVFTGDWVRALCSGGRLVCCPRDILLEPEALYALMHREQVDIAEFVPVVAQSLRHYLQEVGRNLDFMHVIIVGGDVWHVQEYKHLQMLCGPQTRLINSYGLSEVTIDSTFFEETVATLSDNKMMPIGRPYPNTKTYLLDQQLTPSPIGITSELYISSPGLARGYLNQPWQTAEKFIPDPFSQIPGQRLYKSGDLARYLSDGNIEFLGRADHHQVKLRGYRIELSEIEAALMRHTGVQKAVVRLRQNNSENQCLVAYIIPVSVPPPNSELYQFLKETLPDYMIPSAYVSLDDLPISPNGKVDDKALPTPTQDNIQLDKVFAQPRTPTEEVVAAIWTEVLNIEHVSATDNFFERGGHSLLATRVISQIRRVFQIDLPLLIIFEKPTIIDLAEAIDITRQEVQGVQTVPITPVTREQPLPLSFPQERLWILDKLEPGNISYNISLAVVINNLVDIPLLTQCLTHIIDRHEVLRTTFDTIEGQPVQIIHPPKPYHLPVVDLRNLSETEWEPHARQLADDEAKRPFDLSQGPLLRAVLLQLRENRYALLLCMHHIIFDEWSVGVFKNELFALYNAFATNQPSPLTALPIQYADFAHWQRQWLQSDIAKKQLAYWRQQLKGIPDRLSLLLDRPRPPIQTTSGAIYQFQLSEALTSAIYKLAHKEAVTLFMLLLAAFQVLLYRYSGQTNIVVGSPIANRTRAEIEGLIGMFVNTLVLHTDMSGNPTFQNLLAQVRRASLGAYAHQDMPFEKLVEDLQPPRSLSHHPCFQVMFILYNAQETASTLAPSVSTTSPGLMANVEGIENQTAKFDLTLLIKENDGTLGALFEYNTDLFDDDTIKRMADHWQVLLASIVANPAQSIDSLPLLTPKEQTQLYQLWNPPVSVDLPQIGLHQLFEVQAEQIPQATAVIYNNQSLSYLHLNQRANQLAHYLRKIGVGPETLVAVYSHRTLDMIVTLLGILKAGGGYLPLDTAYPQARLTFMLADTATPIIITQQSLQADLTNIHDAKIICIDSDWPLIAEESTETLSSLTQPDNLAYLIYTSGSTGQPKGIAITHQNAVALLNWAAEIFPRSSLRGVLAATSICFDLSVYELFLPLSQGGSIILAEDILKLPTLTPSQPITLMNTVPSAMQSLLNAEALPPAVQIVNLAGEQLKRTLVDQIYAQTKTAVVYNLYGPSEDTTYSTYVLVSAKEKQEPTIGQAITGTQVYILDGNYQPVPVGVVGEIYLAGAGVSRGYLNRPSLTAQHYLPNPFSRNPGSRFYRTGDLGRYLPDGQIVFLGRRDHQIKMNGFRIELGEIETVLNAHPAVQEAIILAREDIEDDRKLVAYLTLKPEQSFPDIESLRQWAKKRLPTYMIPHAFLPLDAFPLTPNGKIDRKALPALELGRPQLRTPFVAPHTAIEKEIAALWQELLHVEKVGVHDNFFALGGHSLIGTQLMLRLRDTFQLEIPLRILFEDPTVSGLALGVQVIRMAMEIKDNADDEGNEYEDLII